MYAKVLKVLWKVTHNKKWLWLYIQYIDMQILKEIDAVRQEYINK